MANRESTPWQPADPEKLSKQFRRLGWLRFWMQIAMLTIPLLLLVYVLFLRSPESGQRIGVDLSNYLSYCSLLVMLFTTFWFFRYARLGKRIADPERRPSPASVEGILWVGLWASGLGIVFSIAQLFGAVGRMLFVLMTTPQTGLMIAPGPGANPVQSISAIDSISLMTLLVILTAELILLAFSVWLLFRTTKASATAAAEPAEAA